MVSEKGHGKQHFRRVGIKLSGRSQSNCRVHLLAGEGKEETTNGTGAVLITKIDSQQLASRVPPRAAGTSDSFVFFGAIGELAYKQIFSSSPASRFLALDGRALLDQKRGNACQ